MNSLKSLLFFWCVCHVHVTDVIYISLTFTRSAHMFYSKIFTLYGQAVSSNYLTFLQPQKKKKKKKPP